MQAQKKHTIYCIPKPEGNLKFALTDLQIHLTKATGNSFVLSTDSTIQHFLVLNKLSPKQAGSYPELKSKGDEAFQIESKGKEQFTITAFSNTALVHGVYTLCDTLGIKWYMPGDENTYIPMLKNLKLKINEIYAPAFELRSFFGTFGTPRNNIIDKDKKVDADWQKWSKRNRLGGNYTLKGHSWNDFIWKNYTSLKSHPNYMALQKDGKRVEVTTASKFCISDTGFQNLFVTYQKKLLKELITKTPNTSCYIISVEPSDGDGFCICNDCQQIGSISNNVFYLANLTARALKSISDKAFVNLYAYNLHAAPPSFNIEPNVIVQLIPYKYQHYDLPESMIEAWKLKTENIFIYDYYGLPLTTFDRPLSGDLDILSYTNRIKNWRKHGIKGVTLESSYSTEATGWGLFLFSRLCWNTDLNIESITADFYQRCYGKNAKLIQQSRAMLPNNLTGAIIMLKDLKDVAPNSLYHIYTNNYKAYLIYLDLLQTYENTLPQHSDIVADSLMSYVYGIFHRKVIHPFPINEYLMSERKSAIYTKQRWNYVKPKENLSRFKDVTHLTDNIINKNFALLLAKYLDK